MLTPKESKKSTNRHGIPLNISIENYKGSLSLVINGIHFDYKLPETIISSLKTRTKVMKPNLPYYNNLVRNLKRVLDLDSLTNIEEYIEFLEAIITIRNTVFRMKEKENGNSQGSSSK
jgi:hypothetical protein